MFKALHKRRLKRILKTISSIDPSKPSNNFYVFDCDRNRAYDRRNDLVKHAVSEAIKAGYLAGYMIHTPLDDIISGRWEPEWCVVACIELPTGQITWHMDGRAYKYDGHSDDMKWNRVYDFLGWRKKPRW